MSSQLPPSSFSKSLRDFSAVRPFSNQTTPDQQVQNRDVESPNVEHLRRFVAESKYWEFNNPILYPLSKTTFEILCEDLASRLIHSKSPLAKKIAEAGERGVPDNSVRDGLTYLGSLTADAYLIYRRAEAELDQNIFGPMCLKLILTTSSNPRLKELGQQVFGTTSSSLAKGSDSPSRSITRQPAPAKQGGRGDPEILSDGLPSERLVVKYRVTPSNLSVEDLEALIPVPGPNGVYADINLVKAVIFFESSWNPNAVSRKKAMGIMQLTPITIKELKIERSEVFDPKVNIEAGSRYLQTLIKRFGEEKLALAAYNWGPTNLDMLLDSLKEYSWENIRAKLPGDTQRYIDNVMGRYKRLSNINK